MALIATKEKATACAKLIKEKASVPIGVYLFGSLVRGGWGDDVDLLLELEVSDFEDYMRNAYMASVHPLLKNTVDDAGDLFWQYFSPKEERSKAALEAVGIDPNAIAGELTGIFPVFRIDIICLPKGWRDRQSALRQQLDASVRGNDPQFFAKLEATATQIA